VVVTHREDDAERMRELLMLAGEAPLSSTTTTRRGVEIPVRYDGEDLESVAQACSLTTEQLIVLHSGVEYEVSFCGFAPGFAYLVGLPHQLHLPRRASPRTRVPAATYSAVYPRESPGGWHLLGTTNASMWDVSRQPPALLQPGMGVRFVRVE
jgi:KipI family sensor histidine kinase inhibitor